MASSLRSRVPRTDQNSAETGFKNPITTIAVNTYENIAQEVTTVAKSVTFSTNQVNTIMDGKMSFTGYDDFSSLRFRLATQVGSSTAGLESTDEAVMTDEHFALEEMMVTEITAHDSGAPMANQGNTSV